MKIKKKISRILGVVLTLALLSSLALVAAPVMALTQPTVSLSDKVISATANYTIEFMIEVELQVADEIIIEFDDGTDISGIGVVVTVAASAGLGQGSYGAAAATYDDDGSELTIDLNTVTGRLAIVTVVVSGIVNPDVAGDYTLDVSTTEEDAVTSTVFTLKNPTVDPLPGIVLVLNANGTPMANFTGAGAIEDAIVAAGEDFTIEIGEGTYYAADDSFDTEDAGVTFEGVDGAAVTVIKMDVTIDFDDITLVSLTIEGDMDIYGNDVTLDKLTIEGEMMVYGNKALITDSVFGKSSSTANEQLVGFSTSTGSKVEDSVFDTTGGDPSGVPADVAIASDSDGLVITGNFFTVDEDDVAVGTVGDATIENNEFTGSSGVGVGIGGDDDDGITISGNTFDGLENAILIDDIWNNPNVLIDGNTISNSTGDAIVVDDTDDWVIIINNSITDTDEDSYVLYVNSDGDGDEIFMVYNNITGNEGNVHNDSGETVDASHNWWGDAAGPPSSSIDDDDGDDPILTAGWLGGPIELGTAVVEASGNWEYEPGDLDAKTVVGVTIEIVDDDVEIIGAAVYDGNPFTSPPYPALGDVIDVYVGEDTYDPIDEVIIKIYADVNDRTEILAWSELGGEWIAPDNQGTSPFGGYAWMIVDATTIPSIEDLAGIPLVLVTAPEPPPPPLVIMAPDPRATDSAITNVAFAWYSVTGADSYELRISKNANLGSPIVLETLPGSAYTYTGSLVYSTPYYWQVTALDGTTVLSVSEINTFTTKTEPEPPAPTPTLTVVIPEITIPPLEQPDVIVVLPDAPTPTITTVAPVIEVPPTPAYVWAIVGIGAVLMIAVIVLIVRTRRIV